MTLTIEGLGHYAPERRLTNDDLSKLVDTNDEWITTRTGIKERRIAAEGEETSDMAVQSALKALEQAELQAEQIDALVCSTCTPDMTIPGSASFIQSKLKTGPIMAFDLNAACSGFVYGLEVCEGLLETGRYQNILFSCAEKFSGVINYKDRGTCILFGDASGSLVVTRNGKGPKLLHAYSGGNGDLAHLLWRPAGGTASPPHQTQNADDLYLKMEGKEVFKHAVRGMNQSAEILLEKAGWSPDSVNWLIPHQANLRLIKSAMDKLKLDEKKVIVNIERYGNTSAASIPVAMSEAQDRFQPGDRILCLAFGAGFTWGGLAIEWA